MSGSRAKPVVKHADLKLEALQCSSMRVLVRVRDKHLNRDLYFPCQDLSSIASKGGRANDGDQLYPSAP